MYLPYRGSRTRLSISTVMDLSILSLTTLPVSVRRRLFSSDISVSCPFPQHRFQPGHILPGLLQQVGLRELTRCLLHAQLELILKLLLQLLLQLVHRLFAQLVRFHHSTDRTTKVVSTGSLAAARAKASRASSSDTTSTSES